MDKGLAVFTNGRKWLLYLLGDGRCLRYITPTPVWQTLSGLMRPLTPKRFTRLWAVSIGDVHSRSLQARKHLHFNGTKNGGNVQGHAPSNSKAGARSTKHFVIQSCACGFYPVNQAATILVGP